jgi:Tol biopolymer transport system component
MPPFRAVVICVVVGLVVLGAIVATVPSSAARMPSVRTLAVIRGPIESFAQAGDRIAWIASSKRCYGRVFVRSLKTGKRTVIDARRGHLCRAGETAPNRGELAFDGKRALWTFSRASNDGTYHEFLSAALDDRVERLVGSATDYHWDNNPGWSLLAGGPGALLAYSYCDYDCDFAAPDSVDRIRGHSARALAPGPKGETRLLDLEVFGRRFATMRNEVRRSCCSSEPTWSPDGRHIVFTSPPTTPGARNELYVIDADGSNRRRLTATAEDERDPDWSPDGLRIAAAAALGEGPSYVYLYDASTGAANRIAEGVAPAWSPDGARLAVLRNIGRRLEVRLVDLVNDGVGRVLLSTIELGHGNDVAWRPDGRELALATETGLFAVTVPGGLVRRLTGPGAVPIDWSLRAVSVDWSPDGRLVLFTATPVEGVWPAATLWMVHADGSRGPEFEGTAKARKDGQIVNMSGEWSPDGSRIAFSSDRLEPRPDERELDPRFLEVYVADATGRNARSITHVPTTLRPEAEVRRVGDGRLLARVSAKRPGTAATAVALSSRILALLVRPTRRPWYRPVNRRKAWLELFDSRTGRALGSVALPPQTADDPKASGWTVVFRTGRTIRALDARTKRMRVLARTRATPVGLSVDRRRVAWAENAGRVAYVRALTLP